MKNKFKFTLLSCLLVSWFFLSFVSFADKPSLNIPSTFPDTLNRAVKRINDSLEKMNQRLPVEKVYLHTDRPNYNIGDTIWFKAYLVDNITHAASNISKILYVQLNDDSANVADRISIRIKDGVGWGQLPLRKAQYHDGNYTLRAYTKWMQNFMYDDMYSQRFYLSTAAEDTWLVKSNTAISRVNNKNQLQVSLFLNRLDKLRSPVALKDVEVKISEDSSYVVLRKDMQTGIDGSLKFAATLKDKFNGRRIKVQITSFDPEDHNKIIQVPLLINRDQKIDLQFLPEGGKLVTGLKSVVGFKAVGEDGRGTQVSGGIFDSSGGRVASFASLYKGMGSVELTPKANEKYTARVEKPAGVVEDYPLPKAEPVGTVIHISNLEEAAKLKVTLAGLNSISADSGFYLIGTTRNKMYYSQKIETGNSEVAIDKKLFPTGIARFTLFNGLTPLNERIVFIDHHDDLQIKLTPGKEHYGKRDSVGLDIEVKDKNGFPLQGNFSLAVTDDAQVKADSTGDYGIKAGLLITTGLHGDYGIHYMAPEQNFKGEIESPGYYIDRKDKQAWEALDNLMLTQGWTDYKWKTVFSSDYKHVYPGGGKEIWFAPQKNLDVTGKVVSLLNATANVPVLVFSQNPAFVRQTLTDKDGVFVFKDLQKIDSGSFFFQVLKRNGKPVEAAVIKIYRFLDPFYFEPSIRYPILPWYVNSDTTDINRAKLRVEQANLKLTGNVLKEVKIKEKKIIHGSWNSFGEGNADYTFDEQDIKRSGISNLYDFLTQNIPYIKAAGVHIFNDRVIPQLAFNHRNMDIKVDGDSLEIDTIKSYNDEIEELSKIRLSNFRGIELVYTRKFTNVNDAQPKLILTTYNNKGLPRYFPAGTKTYRPLPSPPGKIFYSPKYQPQTPTLTADYRSTIFWEPNITTDKNGRAKVSFYTSDTAAGLTFNIQGVSNNGALGSLLYHISAGNK